MPVWLIPTLKAIAPHIGTIISAAKPVFTKKSADQPVVEALVLQQQITELQSAAAANAAHIHDLAAQMQKTVAALEQGAVQVNSRLKRLFVVCVAASALSIGVLIVTIVLIAQRM